ncbi:MFS transporter [Pseudomonas sp. 148P]|uniref:MFS transporter n=1 Tax=Pseudomonas ulcerans TaxID=3115852 RepID=A0ABU7HQA3_9PSED|nr:MULTISPECIES: MFS transporter [unclassified Pseudomonas]MEE1922736.1 MFS transporter [Pseudomonas sp. 147P]MEE1933713.1 MFS transporter [Pseudomonas sp. 148P]
MNLISRRTFASDQDCALYNRIAWRILPFLFVLYVVAFLDRVNVGFAKLQMAADIGLSDMAFGFGAGVFFLGYCLFEIPSNMMLQKVGARLWITRIMVVWGLISTSMMFVSSPTSFYILRFLLGVAEAGFYPGVVLYLTYWLPSYAQSQGLACLSLGVGIAGVLGGPLSGWIMQTFAGMGGLAGWQWLFLLEGLPAVILGIVVFFYLDDRPGKAHWLTPQQNAKVVADLERQRQTHERAGAPHTFASAFRHRGLWCLVFVNFALLCGTYGVSFWLPQIIRSLGEQTLLQTGLISAIPFAVASVCMLIVGKHSDRTRERRWHAALSILAACLGLVLSAALHAQPLLCLFSLCIAMAGCLSAFNVLWAIPGTLLTGSATAAGIALMTTVGNLGGYASPFMMGWVKEASGHLEYGLYILAALTFAAALVMARVRPRVQPLPHAPLAS